MAEIQDLNVTDASNTGRWPENMAFSAVNDAGRADEGLLARWYKDLDSSVTASGSSNAYAITSNRTISSLVNNTIMTFGANHTNTGAATLNLNGLGAKSIKRFNGAALAAGDITSGQPVTVIYKSSPDLWYMMTAAAALATAITTFADFTENASPGTPAANVARLHARDNGLGNSILAYMRDDGALIELREAFPAEMEAAASIGVFVTPARQHRHPGHPKAWAIVNSAGTAQASYNVSTSRTGTGLYQMTLSTAMSGTSYAVIPSIHGTAFGTVSTQVQISSASVFIIRTASAGVAADADFAFVVMGDQV